MESITLGKMMHLTNMKVYMYVWKCPCGKIERFGSLNDYQGDPMLKQCFMMCQKCGRKHFIRNARRYLQKVEPICGRSAK